MNYDANAYQPTYVLPLALVSQFNFIISSVKYVLYYIWVCKFSNAKLEKKLRNEMWIILTKRFYDVNHFSDKLNAKIKSMPFIFDACTSYAIRHWDGRYKDGQHFDKNDWDFWTRLYFNASFRLKSPAPPPPPPTTFNGRKTVCMRHLFAFHDSKVMHYMHFGKIENLRHFKYHPWY